MAGERSGGGEQSVDWLAACRRIVERQRSVFAEAPDAAARTEYEGVGVGGDNTLVIDRRCEDEVFAELERLHADGHEFTAISEERGQVAFGSPDRPTTIVIDPIDGSLNARRTIPAYSVSIAVAAGDSMGDVEFGFVHDFGVDEEFSATRGGGARLNGEPLVADRPGEGLEVVALESADPATIAPAVAELSGRVFRLRAPGSIAISLAYVAAGRFDGMLTARPCRSVDAAAGQLIAREARAHVAFGERSLDEATLDLDARYPLAAAVEPGGLDTLVDVQRRAGVER